MRPVAWRGSDIIVIHNKQTHVAIATWNGDLIDPKLKVEGIKLNISS